MPDKLLLVFCTCPDRGTAERIADQALAARLAACVNVGGPSSSRYTWKGSIESAEEYTLTIKTTGARYAALEAAIVGLHPYELPEIIAVPVNQGLPGYLEWVAQCTSEEPEQP